MPIILAIFLARITFEGCRGLHLDGHQPDAALYYAQECRRQNILTSLDGGGLRAITHELLGLIDVAIMAERLCEQIDLDERAMLAYLKSRGCKIGGITQGERGMIWYDETGAISRMPSLPVPKSAIIDTSGAGDVFHGAYMAHYLTHPQLNWQKHFTYARAASAYKIQHLGNEAGLPSPHDIATLMSQTSTPERVDA